MAVKPKPTSKLKTTVITIKVSPAERKLLGQAAGLFPVSTWARVRLVELAKEELKKRGIIHDPGPTRGKK